MSAERIENVEDAVAEVERLRAELSQAQEDRTGACLARWEEEQDNARLRLALKSAKRGRREARGLLEITEASRKRWRDAEIASSKELKSLRARVAELEALTPAPIQTCQKCGAGYTLGEPCQACAFRERMAAELKARSDSRPSAEWFVEAVAPQGRSLEDPHDSPLHSPRRIPHDLEWPEPGGQR